ncbi:polysaccharide deacetylase family protein [Clostridium sp.]|uniref:polysaccharide deacetylase family protein n=1 Tax=Clostridium sp. TaxID=1506 RepID=UPI001DE6F504|nr:polysaccharide deacetylase family protein [Clostridium sp.]MBS5936737.1 polysaccharide deacetylase family protein [Clostridium sp.]
MKKLISIVISVVIIVLIVFGGYKYLNKKSEVTNLNDAQNEETNAEEETVIDEVEENDKDKINEDNYITLNIEDVKVPILMYHSISAADPNNSLLVPPEMFREQVKYLKEAGFTPMLLEDVVEAFSTGHVPKKPVAITFDDGYADNYSEGYKILKEFDMKATFFIITDNTDADGYYLSSAQLKEMKKGGMGIESHTSRHIEFPNISREDKKAIIQEAIDTLKEKVGVDSKFLCYPVGRYDEETMEVAEEMGVKAAVTTEGGIATASDGLYSLKRVRMSPMNIETFKSIFSDF